MSDENKEQYVTKEFFNEQMQSMMELLSSSIQTNISDAMQRHVVNSCTTEDVSAAARAAMTVMFILLKSLIFIRV